MVVHTQDKKYSLYIFLKVAFYMFAIFFHCGSGTKKMVGGGGVL